jgi:hypothetical protein
MFEVRGSVKLKPCRTTVVLQTKTATVGLGSVSLSPLARLHVCTPPHSRNTLFPPRTIPEFRGIGKERPRPSHTSCLIFAQPSESVLSSPHAILSCNSLGGFLGEVGCPITADARVWYSIQFDIVLLNKSELVSRIEGILIT